MKVASWEAMGLSARKMVAVSACAGAAAALSAFLATRDILGPASVLLAAAVGAGAAYAVAGTPKRSLLRSSLLQAREAPAISAAASVYLRSTGSRSKTIMMLHSNETRLNELFGDARRSTLLGVEPSVAFGAATTVTSGAVESVIATVVAAEGNEVTDQGQDAESMVRASVSREETKFPVFLTISFFLPIMLMLVAAIGHHDTVISVVSLAVVETVILDLALSFASADRRLISA
jgi:hypothetical protein